MHVNIFVISKEITIDLALNLLQDGRTKMCSAATPSFLQAIEMYFLQTGSSKLHFIIISIIMLIVLH